MKLKQLFFLALLIISACKDKNDKKTYNVQMDIRFGNRYYSLFLSEQGNCKVNKGFGTYYTEPFKPQTFDSSISFKIDSISLFYDKLSTFLNSPKLDTTQDHVARAEIYFERKKILDSYKWDERVWGVFRTIMEKIPKKFNPFRLSDDPF